MIVCFCSPEKPLSPRRNPVVPEGKKPKQKQKASNKNTESPQLLTLMAGLVVPECSNGPKQNRDVQESSQESVSSTNSLGSVLSQPPSFILYPSHFDIVLCVDNCEFYGRYGMIII